MKAAAIKLDNLGYKTQVEDQNGVYIGYILFGADWTEFKSIAHGSTKWFTNGMRESDTDVLSKINDKMFSA